MKSIYTEDFYHKNAGGSLSSAQYIVPIMYELLKPKSVVDIGCGLGLWLQIFEQLGVSQILGIDGEYVSQNLLKIPSDKFLALNLNEPFEIKEKFDLAISLEVAEHLLPESAADFVHSLAKLSDVILFSAAIPKQGGVNHLNEQWQSYWIDLFENSGYIYTDLLKHYIWEAPEIECWYKQNILLFIKNDAIYQQILSKNKKYTIKNMIHPDMWDRKLLNYEKKIDSLEGYVASLEKERKNIYSNFKNLIKSIFKF